MTEKRSANYLVRPESHDVDEQAQALFTLHKPRHWLPQKVSPDFAVDYHVLIGNPESREVKGDAIYLQLKGTAKGDYRRDNSVIAYELEKKHLTFFSDEAKLPLFLLVVDLERQAGYWLFMQEYLRYRKQAWQNLSSYTVHLPLTNCWNDHALWESEARRAIGYLRASVSVQEVLRPKLELLEGLDPRFEIHPEITRDRESYNVRAKEAVDLNFAIKPPAEGKGHLRSLLAQGKPIPLCEGQMTVTGSPLFEHIAEGASSVHFRSDLRAAVTLRCQTREGLSIASLPPIAGRITGGLEEGEFTSDHGQLYSVSFGPLREGEGGKFSLRCDATVWQGHPVLDLVGFDDAHAFYAALTEHRTLQVEGRHDGKFLFALKVPEMPGEAFAGFLELLRRIGQARAVARHYHLNPTFTHASLEQAIDQGHLALLADIVERGEHQLPEMAHFLLNGELAKDYVQGKLLSHQFDSITVRTEEAHTVPLLGEQVPVGQLEIHMARGRVDIPRAELERRIAAANDLVEVPLASDPGGAVTLRQLSSLTREAE